jgi:2-polyprenyl-3-methyl-5-hydroxy-6-metoxy-1,4-benzoquinol methylase
LRKSYLESDCMPLLMPDTQTRSVESEIMDEPEVTQQEFVRALREIRWVNRYLGGTTAILDALKTLCKTDHEPLRILDIGTGSADIPMALAEWGRATQRRLEITAVDLHPLAVQEAKARVSAYPEISVEACDAFQLPYPPESFDFVISSMFLHHLDDNEAVILLQKMVTLARRGVIINDLERHPLAWLGIRLLSILTAKGAVFYNDSALSVLRGFKKKELNTYCQQAGLKNFQIQHRHPFRWLLIWQRTPHSNM